MVTVGKQMQHAKEFQAWKSVGNKDGAPEDPSRMHGVKKLSILFHLPYWKVRH